MNMPHVYWVSDYAAGVCLPQGWCRKCYEEVFWQYGSSLLVDRAVVDIQWDTRHPRTGTLHATGGELCERVRPTTLCGRRVT